MSSHDSKWILAKNPNPGFFLFFYGREGEGWSGKYSKRYSKLRADIKSRLNRRKITQKDLLLITVKYHDYVPKGIKSMEHGWQDL